MRSGREPLVRLIWNATSRFRNAARHVASIEQFAAIKRVDVHPARALSTRLRGRSITHRSKEVPRRVDAANVETDTLGNALVNKHKRDGKAAMGPQHFRYITIGRIV